MRTLIVWFRRDLRLADNPALWQALQEAERVVPVYIHAPIEAGDWQPGGASRWWLHHSLTALDEGLRRRGGSLTLRRGPSLAALLELAETTGAEGIYWNRQYEPYAIARDREIKAALRERGLRTESFNAALLHEPWQVANQAGEPFRVFTPFWKACLAHGIDQPLLPTPEHVPGPEVAPPSEPLDAFKLLPRIPWDRGFAPVWRPGEAGALDRLEQFVQQAIGGYAEHRNLPGSPTTSRLSPHLHFGEVGPRQIVHAARVAADGAGARDAEGVRVFLSEIGWREFAYHLLFHFPHTPAAPLDPKFASFPWESDDNALAAWQRGQTGIPIVDAGLRELWTTGWMHNRVRMIVASLLTKNLLIHWSEGARWFWDTLVDADLASNTLGWQWTAGCGADAAPYFRIFNPVLQGEKFDPDGDYVRRWVPELASVPAKLIHRPWEADSATLRRLGLALGRDYPLPIVDLKESRDRALARFEAIKKGAAQTAR